MRLTYHEVLIARESHGNNLEIEPAPSYHNCWPVDELARMVTLGSIWKHSPPMQTCVNVHTRELSKGSRLAATKNELKM